MASVNSPEDVINLVLRRIGHPLRIGSIYDGSVAAKASLDVYGQTRDELLRELKPDFARREVNLTLLKSAPVNGYIPPVAWDPTVNPPLPWLFEYAYNADMIEVGSVRAAPLFLPNFDPQPNSFETANDNAFNPAQKVILTNVANAVATYTGRITNPATWEAGFVEALVGSLARRLAVSLSDPKLLEFEAKDEAAETAVAGMRQG